MQPTQTFHDHVRELRNRLAWVMLTILGCSVVGYVFRNPVISYIHRPLDSPLYYTTPAGSFNFVMKISLMLGLFVAIPVILYHLIRFIEPALTRRFSRRNIAKVLIASMVLAIIGAAFGYYIILPMSLKFFNGYSNGTIRPLISATEYLNYVLNIIITFILLFQIPLIFLFINMIKPLNPRGILKYQKWVIVAAFAIAVVLPFTYAPITQFLMAAPIIFLYYLSIILLAVVNRRANKKELSRASYSQPQLIDEDQTIAKQQPELTSEKLVAAADLQPHIKRSLYLDGIIGSRTDSEATNARLASIRQSRVKNIEPIKPTKRTQFVDGFRPVLT